MKRKIIILIGGMAEGKTVLAHMLCQAYTIGDYEIIDGAEQVQQSDIRVLKSKQLLVINCQLECEVKYLASVTRGAEVWKWKITRVGKMQPYKG